MYLFIQFYLEISWDNKLLKNSIQEIFPIKSAWWFSQEKTVALSILIASSNLSFFYFNHKENKTEISTYSKKSLTSFFKIFIYRNVHCELN